MKVIALKFENYRNLKENIITPCDGVNIIYGDNAQGKTNLLEALWFFCGGHSFRGSKDSEIINWDENFARIEMRFLGQEREQTAKILFRGGKKSVEINGVQKNSAAALIERFCAVVFSPEHLSLIKRGPGERRKFIDSAICREKLKNAVVLSKYNRILNQRNSLLKDIYRRPSLADTLPVWDEPLLKSGAVLLLYNLLTYSGIFRIAGAGRKDDVGGSKLFDFVNCYFIVSYNLDIGIYAAAELYKIVGKAVVVINKKYHKAFTSPAFLTAFITARALL
mgnify:CR=1 FL=1